MKTNHESWNEAIRTHAAPSSCHSIASVLNVFFKNSCFELQFRAQAHSQMPTIKCVRGSSNELCSIFGLETNLDLSVPNISRIEHLQKRHKHLWLSLDWYTPIPCSTVAQNMVISVNHRQGLGMDFPSLVKNGTSGGGWSSIPRISRLSIGNTFLQLIHSPFLFSALLRFPSEACTSNSDCSPLNIQKSAKSILRTQNLSYLSLPYYIGWLAGIPKMGPGP